MTVRILIGDARARLGGLPDNSIHCAVTSPPYFGLRDYGVELQIWGGATDCAHEWADATVRDPRHYPEGAPTAKRATNTGSHQRGIKPGDFCAVCGAWRGSLGLEPTVDLYVEHLVEMFREVRRVLRPDGTLWLNLGDSYAGSWGAQSRRDTASNDPSWHSSQIKNHPKRASHAGAVRASGVKPKDLYGVPWLVAFALRADGWWLRQDIIWSKPNPMPEAVTDRCTKAHEYLFLLSKSGRYYYDADAIRQPFAEASVERLRQDVMNQAGSDRVPGKANGPMRAVGLLNANRSSYRPGSASNMNDGDHVAKSDSGLPLNPAGRNRRSVWQITTQPLSLAHFATSPPALVEPCILAGTSEKGVCPACGAPWARSVSRSRTRDGRPLDGSWPVNEGGVRTGASGVGHWRDQTATQTLGWSPTCSCDAGAPVPAAVLDPFGGAGTVGLVADRLGRNATLIELNPEYAAMARRRIDADAPERRQIEGDDRHSSAIGQAIESADSLPLFAPPASADCEAA